MASNHNAVQTRDLKWLRESIKSERLNLHNISFYLSQPTSGFYQETQNSMNIQISEDKYLFFSQLITVLGTAKNTQTSLKSLEFHSVKWDIQALRNLGVVLDRSINIKHLVFKRSKFDTECLSEISEILKRNRVIKDIMFSESGIKEVGASLLASALKVNDSLEELRIWEDSIGSKGAEELSMMIEENCTLKALTIFDYKTLTASPLISSVLARNRAMEVHVWSGANGERSSKVVEFLPESSELRIYNLDVSGSCRVACSLGYNTTVRSLDMTGVRLKSRWAKEFRWVLEQNKILKEVTLSKTYLKDKGLVYVAAGLFKNKSLETLCLNGNSFSGTGIEHLLCPLTKFSATQRQANITLKSVTFGGKKTKIGREGLAAILQMLATNESVTWLGIYDDESLKPDEVIQIFKSLQRNSTLRHFSLQGCMGVTGERVQQTIMETLQVNPWIEEIDLERTPLRISGQAEGIYQKLSQMRVSNTETEMELLKNMPLTQPKSCRVFLYGQEHAGTSTLWNSIFQNFSSSKLSYMEQVRIKGGTKIRTFKDEDTKISIWNLAGQHEMYSLHDLMFPGHGSTSFFVIISSLFKTNGNGEPNSPEEVEDDIQYWLRYIVSNWSRAVEQCMLPNVTVVLTHYDKINQWPSQNMQVTMNSIQRLRGKFECRLDFSQTVFTVDARSSASVTELTQHILKTSKMILETVPRVYQVCNDLVQILSDWGSKNYNKPAMRWKEFDELCQVNVPPLRIRSRHDNKVMVEMSRRAVAASLHRIGEVIYFDELGFLILDCEWFCGEVLLKLAKLDDSKRSSAGNKSFISREELENIIIGSFQSWIPGMGSKVLEILQASELVRLMLKLELCYEKDPSDPNSLLLVPSILEDGRGKPQRWEVNEPDCLYAGRHLECDDSRHMIIPTPGFLPRLQVLFYNRIMEVKKQLHGATIRLEKYLVSINISDICNIRVELGGQLGSYIDVLVCSKKNLTETLRLNHKHIIPAIQSLCYGVTLTENIMRPECVRNLTLPRYRKTQFVSLQLLKEALLLVPAESIYNYKHSWDPVSDAGRSILGSGFDFAIDLLSDDEFREVLHGRYHDLHNFPVGPDEPGPSNIHESKVDPTFSGIAKGVETVVQRLKSIEQEIKYI